MEPRRPTSTAPPKYADLFLHLATGRDGYVVHAWSSSSRGEATERFVSPELDTEEPSKKKGERLFNALFTGEVLELYKRLEANALRLKLMIDPLDPALAPLQALPWELLRKPGDGFGLALSRQRSIIRHLWIPQPVTACPRPERLRILVVAASPRGREPLDRETEICNLKKALAPAGEMIEIVEPIPSTCDGMRRALLAQDCHVLHFIGHGGLSAFTGKGFLAFEKEDGTEDAVFGTDLVEKLAGFPLRLAMLNSCVSMQVANSLVMEGLPAVVAMREPIEDESAAAFSSAFYTRLAAGDPVDAAIVEGRQAAGEEWGIPMLFMRTPEGELFPAQDLAPPEPRPQRVAWLAVAAAGILILIAIWLGCLWWLVSDGVAHLQSGRPGPARERFETALALAPWEAEIHADLAAAAERLGDGEEAEEHYREAVRLQPASPVYLFNLGHFLNERGQFQEACKWLGRAAKILRQDPRRSPELDRDRVDTYGELARAALNSGGLAEAQESLKAALAIDPDRAPLHRLLGEVALRQKNAGAAVGHLQAALDRYPRGERGRIETRSLLVEAYDRLGDPSATCRAVEELHAEDPVGITPWALSVEAIARRRSCPPRI